MRRSRSIPFLLILLLLSNLYSVSTVKLRLVDQEGRPLGPSSFLLRSEGGEERVLTSNPMGIIVTELGPGEYELVDVESGEVVARWDTKTIAGDDEPLDILITSPVSPTEDAELEPSPADPQTLELQAIGAYRTLDPSRTPAEWGSLAQVLNPFEARRPRRIHGSIYEFHRNDNFDARNFFDPVGKPLPEFKRNQFGFQLGGDIGSDLNLFGSYDGLRVVRGSTLLSHVPTPAQKRGDFAELALDIVDPLTGLPFPENRIPANRIHDVSQRLLSIYPNPNRNEVERNFVNSQPQVDDADNLLIRADYQLSDQTQILGRYNYTKTSEVDVEPLPSFNVFEDGEEHEVELSINHNFSPRMILDVEIEASRDVSGELSANSGRAGLLASLGIEGLAVGDPVEEGYPDLSLDGYASVGDGDSPSTQVRNRISLDNNLTYSFEKHQLFISGDWTYQQLNNYRSGNDRRGSFSFGGTFTGDAFADFLLGLPEDATRTSGSDRVDMRRHYFRFTFRDSWRISPRFDLTLGVQYTYNQPFRSVRPVAGFYPLLVEPQGPGQIIVSGTPEAERLGFGGAGNGSLVLPDKNDWSPRVALAYSPFGNNQTVLRASYNIFYDGMDDWQAISFMGRTFPFYTRESAVSSSLTPELDLADPFRTVARTVPTIRGIERDLKSAYIQRWSLTLQRKLSTNWTLETEYEGSKGTGMHRLIPGNIPLPGPGLVQERRPDSTFGSFSIVSGGGSFSHNEISFEVERQLADGFALRGGGRWGRRFSDIVFHDISNPRDLASERGPSGFPELNGYANYIFDLPFGGGRTDRGLGFFNRLISGWRLSGTTRFHSGSPFTVRLSGDPNNDGLSGDRPDRVGPGTLDSAQQSIDRWFATDDFAQPAQFAFGNSGRNILKSPGFQNWDIAMSKRTTLADGHFLEFRVELFNAFNHVNFQRPSTTFGTSSFGQIFGAARSREIEIALKYSF